MFGLFSKALFSPVTDIPDLNGKVILVTGGNANLGLHTIKHLARHGAKVYMGARSETRAKEALEQLKAEGPGNGEVVWLKLDLSDPHKAKKGAEELLGLENRLDVLIHNAAMQRYAKSFEDIQDVMMINHISPFIVTQTLLPLLRKTAEEPNSDVRVIPVTSDTHRLIRKASFKAKDDINKEYADSWAPSMMRYGLSKLCNILYIHELQRRFDAKVLPIITLLVNQVESEPARITFRSSTQFPTPDIAAHNSVFAAAAPIVKEKPKIYKTCYLDPIAKIGDVTAVAKDEALQKELWETTERLVEEIGL
ncbi:NAD(P)-binding protein [Abortiporus biennis]|nr:NAD(P)-binding protein [Abortiporus biennis]